MPCQSELVPSPDPTNSCQTGLTPSPDPVNSCQTGFMPTSNPANPCRTEGHRGRILLQVGYPKIFIYIE